MTARLDCDGRVLDAAPAWVWPDVDATEHRDAGISLLDVWEAAAPTDPVSAAMSRALRRALAGDLSGPRRFLKAWPNHGSGWWEVTIWCDPEDGHAMVRVVESDLFVDDVVFPGAVAAAMTRARHHRDRSFAQTVQGLATQRLFATTLSLESLAMGTDSNRSRRVHELVAEIDDVIKELRQVALTVDAPATYSEVNGH